MGFPLGSNLGKCTIYVCRSVLRKGWELVDVAQVHVSLTIIVFVNQHVWAALAAGFLWFCVFLW